MSDATAGEVAAEGGGGRGSSSEELLAPRLKLVLPRAVAERRSPVDLGDERFDVQVRLNT